MGQWSCGKALHTADGDGSVAILVIAISSRHKPPACERKSQCKQTAAAVATIPTTRPDRASQRFVSVDFKGQTRRLTRSPGPLERKTSAVARSACASRDTHIPCRGGYGGLEGRQRVAGRIRRGLGPRRVIVNRVLLVGAETTVPRESHLQRDCGCHELVVPPRGAPRRRRHGSPDDLVGELIAVPRTRRGHQGLIK